MSLLLNSVSNLAKTAKGALSYKTSGSALLDFFGKAGALRAETPANVLAYFNAAFKENPTYALKALFFFRDVRGGQGERRLFRVIIKDLAVNYTELMASLIKHIPEYGRWDDLLSFEGTPLQDKAFTLFAKQLDTDYANMDNAKYSVSLAGKWAPSENASSTVTRLLGQVLRKYVGVSSRNYRQMLSALRQRIDVVERRMCSNDWSSINYEQVPSNANVIYRNAFKKHDPERNVKFHEKVQKGEAKINAAVLYPYDIVGNILNKGMHKVGTQYFPTANTSVDALALNNLWNALPDYFGENKENSLAIVDTSGSMTNHGGLPIKVAVSLGIYIAERNKGAFQDYFMSFSATPQLHKVQGNTIVDKVANLVKTDWGMTTNLQAVFDLVLNRAVQDAIPEEEMPKKLYIISDMQFDVACTNNQLTNFEIIRAKYEQAGYVMPELVFWQVNGISGDSPIKKNHAGVTLVSGCSPSILKSLLGKVSKTPYDTMIEVLNNPRYEAIGI